MRSASRTTQLAEVSMSRTPQDPSPPSTGSGATREARIASEPAVIALRSALQGYLTHHSPTEQLRRAFRLMCAEARRQGLRLDHVLHTFERAAATLSGASSHGRERGRELLESLRAMCISEYFAGEGTARTEYESGGTPEAVPPPVAP
jgi:hypothetical protein